MRSRLYSGVLWHTRISPKKYRFSHGVFYFDLDLDELALVERRIALVSRNRFNVLSFFDRDHMAPAGVPLADAVRRHLAARAICLDGARVSLLTNMRVLGYVFNPVSFYFVRGEHGELRHVMAEVHNTHGEEHVYDLARAGGGRGGEGVYESDATKEFYVSPFIEMDARYAFRLEERDGGRMRIRIDEYRGDEWFFGARLDVAPRPLTNTEVLRMLARYPFITLKTIGLIHWHGLRLWLRGVRYLPHPSKGAG